MLLSSFIPHTVAGFSPLDGNNIFLVIDPKHLKISFIQNILNILNKQNNKLTKYHLDISFLFPKTFRYLIPQDIQVYHSQIHSGISFSDSSFSLSNILLMSHGVIAQSAALSKSLLRAPEPKIIAQSATPKIIGQLSLSQIHCCTCQDSNQGLLDHKAGAQTTRPERPLHLIQIWY